MKLITIVFIMSVISTKVLCYKLRIILPQVTPDKDDDYICSSFPVPNKTQESFIKSYQSTTNSSVAHHILLYGCSEPFSTESFYSCSRICGRGIEKIIFAWAKDAQRFEYPPDTGMAVGGTTGIDYLVLQVHYLKKMTTKDSSGIEVQLTHERPKNLVTIAIMFAPSGMIPAKSDHVNMDISCRYDGKSNAYPLAFRTHAHSLGRTISGFRVSGSNSTEVDLIGIGNPQWPQTFYKANFGVVIKPGDILMARCVFDSTQRNRDTRIGSTHHDEMCNFYMMLVSKNIDGKLDFDSCGGNEFGNELWKNVPSFSKEYSGSEPSLKLLLSIQSSPKIKFASEWKVQYPLGEVSSVATLQDSVNPSNYSLIVLHRADRFWNDKTFESNIYKGDKTPISSETILEVNPKTGKVLRKAGKNMFFIPHGVTVTKDGRYMWVTDVALHQIMRFPVLPRDGVKLINDEPDIILGERFVPGSDQHHFCKPSKVEVDRQGFIFVADGYCNQRIVCLSPNGTYIREWKNKDGMDVVHSISIEEHKSGDVTKNIVWVADRENERIIGFKFDGSVAFTSPPMKKSLPIFGIEYNPSNGYIYGVSSNGQTAGDSFVLDYTRNSFTKPWHSNFSFKAPHDLSLADNGSVIFVAELHLKTVVKFVLDNGYLDPFYDYIPDKDLTTTMNSTMIAVTVFLSLLCFVFCLFILRIVFRTFRPNPKVYNHMYTSKHGFKPLNQKDDNEADDDDSDSETGEFFAPKNKPLIKPNV